MDRKKIIEDIEDGILMARATATKLVHMPVDKAEVIVELLKEQERKTGYWMNSAGDEKCSVCGMIYSDLYPDYNKTHFCPNCGAKMEGR